MIYILYFFIASQIFFIKIELILFNSSDYDHYRMEKSLSKYERSQLIQTNSFHKHLVSYFRNYHNLMTMSHETEIYLNHFLALV